MAPKKEEVTLKPQVNTSGKYNQFLYTEECRGLVSARIFSTRKISVSDSDVKAVLSDIFRVFDYINAQPVNTTIILDRPMSEIPIPAEFKSWIRPNSVRYDSGDLRCPNIMGEISYVGKVPDFNTYLNAIARLRGFKKESSTDNLVYLDQLRIDRSFEEVRSIASFEVCGDVKVAYNGEPFIPVHLVAGREFFYEFYYNTFEETIIRDWIATL